MPNPLINKRVLMASGNKYGAYTNAYYTQVLAAGGTLTPTELKSLTVFENSVGSDMAEFDRLWIHGLSNQIAARISFVNPTSTAITEVNSPTWTAYQGYTGNGSTSYLNTNYNSATNGVKYTQNNASYGAYARIDQGSTGSFIMGCYQLTPSAGVNYMSPNYTGSFYYDVNNSSDALATGVITTGLISAVRTGATANSGYRNGTLINTTVVSSVPLLSKNFYVLAWNGDGIAQRFSTNQVSSSYIGSGAINQSTFYIALQALGTTLGWAVSPLAGGLIGSWSLNSTPNDNLGLNNGVATNLTYTNGKFAQCGVFSGTSSVSIASLSLFSRIQNNQAFSLSAWIQVTSTGATNWFLGSTQTAIEKGFYLGTSSTNLSLFITNGSGVNNMSVTVNNVINDTNWHNVIVIGDAANVYIYVDGILQSTTAVGVASVGNSTNATFFGRIPGANFLIGNMDEINLWDRVLTSTEITQLQTKAYPFL